MLTKRLLALLLSLCLLAGCGGAPASSGSAAPPDPPASASEPPPPEDPAPAPERPTGILPQEDPEHPGDLAGTILYYTPGNRLTLYSMMPETGEIRTVRENDFWNGREIEDVSPSGRWILLYSWDGAPSRRVVALSLYDVERDLLVNLERAEEEAWEGTWSEKHWFSGRSTYRFTDDSTFYYQNICYCQYYDPSHLHRYRIDEEGRVTADVVTLECPLREQAWGSSCILLPEKREVFSRMEMGEDRIEWLTWDLDSGKLLSRTPGDNGWEGSSGWYRDGVFYHIHRDWGKISEDFQLAVYYMDTDTVEVLGSGTIPKAPGMEDEPIDVRGVQEEIWIEELREDGTILLRSAGEEIRYQAASSYREALWDPASGGDIRFGERQSAVDFPVAPARGYSPIFTTAPDGTGLYLPLPQEMTATYSAQGRPYPITTLPTGELLFLAKEPLALLPQEDPDHPGQLTGAPEGNHRLALYRFTPESGEVTMVQEPIFWNGLALEDISPSGNRLLLATRNPDRQAAALSVYDMEEHRLFNLNHSLSNDGSGWRWKYWFPGEYRYCFTDERIFIYQEYQPNEKRQEYYIPYYCIGERDIADDGWQHLDSPEAEDTDGAPCVYLPGEKTLACLLTAQDGTPACFTWQIDIENGAMCGYPASLLGRIPAESAPYSLEGAQPSVPAAPDIPLPAELAEARFLTALPTGELLFLAKDIGVS